MYAHFLQDLLHVIHTPVELYTVGYFYQKDMILVKGVLSLHCVSPLLWMHLCFFIAATDYNKTRSEE